MAALNPHAGEQGLFGDEEQEVIAPAVDAARAAGLDVAGPFPTDTLMVRARDGEFDAVVAMYHDQGHIALKLLGMNAAVNITLGLPIVRTSVAHGTAFDRAWQGTANADGMVAAILTAAQLTQSRRRLGRVRRDPPVTCVSELDAPLLLLAGGHLRLAIAAHRFQVFGGAIVPLGVAGREIELAGGDRRVERHGSKLQQHERFAAELKRDNLLAAAFDGDGDGGLSSLRNSIRYGNKSALADEHKHFLRQALRQESSGATDRPRRRH